MYCIKDKEYFYLWSIPLSYMLVGWVRNFSFWTIDPLLVIMHPFHESSPNPVQCNLTTFLIYFL